jgi:hypothetical protein
MDLTSPQTRKVVVSACHYYSLVCVMRCLPDGNATGIKQRAQCSLCAIVACLCARHCHPLHNLVTAVKRVFYDTVYGTPNIE